MFRKQRSTSKSEARDSIAWRGKEVSRLEAFSDAVFAFAVTLLIVSLEVPKSFDHLLDSMKGFLGFGICFLFLFKTWQTQVLFFRRYGLQDQTTFILNGMLLFVVLFYVYPMKFLFTLLTHGLAGTERLAIRPEQVRYLIVIYSLAYMAICILFALMYRHAADCRSEIGLSSSEAFHTTTHFYHHVSLAAVALITILAAMVLPTSFSGMAGMLYALIAPTLSVLHAKRRKLHAILNEQPAIEAETRVEAVREGE